MNKDQTQGRVKEVKGKYKQAVGKLTGDKTLERKGTIEHAKGVVQASYGDLKQDTKKAT